MLHCLSLKNLLIMLYKCPYTILKLCISFCDALTLSTSWFLLAPVCGGVFTLAFRFCINSNCVGAQSLLSKDFGEEAVTCELLLAT